MTRIVLVPGVLALLPAYAGIEDPVAELRGACLDAVAWLGPEVEVLGDAQGSRVGEYLLEAAEVSRLGAGVPRTPTTAGGAVPARPAAVSYLVVGNGSARRSEKAPGHLDERAHGFDEALGASLRAGRFEVDEGLAAELLASVEGIVAAGRIVTDAGPAIVDHDDDPYGVQYWVMRWQCGS